MRLIHGSTTTQRGDRGIRTVLVFPPEFIASQSSTLNHKAVLQVFRRGSYRDLTVTVAEFEPDTPARVAQWAPSTGAAAAMAWSAPAGGRTSTTPLPFRRWR